MLKRIKCPKCKSRLFDVEKNASGRVNIKCSKCKGIIDINLEEAEKKSN